MSETAVASSPSSDERSRAAAALAATIRARASTHADKWRAREHEMRQAFRRLVDPGIMRPNNKDRAIESIKTLLRLSDNLLDDPDNAKFQRFKSSNPTIKRLLVETKGALEYAVAMGFHRKVELYENIYVFNHEQTADLRIGNEVLKETLDREMVKVERSKHAMEREKASREAAARNAMLAFEDDRKTKAFRDELEAQARRAQAERVAARDSSTSPTEHSDPSHAIQEEVQIPLNGGFRLGDPIPAAPPAVAEIHVDAPPAYDDPMDGEHIPADDDDDDDDDEEDV